MTQEMLEQIDVASGLINQTPAKSKSESAIKESRPHVAAFSEGSCGEVNARVRARSSTSLRLDLRFFEPKVRRIES